MAFYPYSVHPQLRCISIPILPKQENDTTVTSEKRFYWVPCAPKFPHPLSDRNHISRFDGMRLDYSVTTPVGHVTGESLLLLRPYHAVGVWGFYKPLYISDLRRGYLLDSEQIQCAPYVDPKQLKII